MFANYLRKTISDVFSCIFLFSAVISVYLFEVLVVVHEVHENKLYVYFHAIAGSYVFINILGNLFKVMLINTSTTGTILPSLLKPFWQFCSLCEANAPPRAFHCYKCRTCVLKRDHHCVFACCCIGLKNFRYYLVFLFFMAIGALYATLLNMFFIWKILGGVTIFSVLAHFVPFIFWVLGYLTCTDAFYTLLSMLSITGFLFVMNLFILHTRQMLRNQTSYESVRGNTYYNLGWKQNLVESLGSRWYMVWLLPTVVSPLPTDGLSYTVRKELEDHQMKNR